MNNENSEFKLLKTSEVRNYLFLSSNNEKTEKEKKYQQKIKNFENKIQELNEQLAKLTAVNQTLERENKEIATKLNNEEHLKLVNFFLSDYLDFYLNRRA